MLKTSPTKNPPSAGDKQRQDLPIQRRKTLVFTSFHHFLSLCANFCSAEAPAEKVRSPFSAGWRSQGWRRVHIRPSLMSQTLSGFLWFYLIFQKPRSFSVCACVIVAVHIDSSRSQEKVWVNMEEKEKPSGRARANRIYVCVCLLVSGWFVDRAGE